MPKSNVVQLVIPKTQSPWQVKWTKFTKAQAKVAIGNYDRQRTLDDAHVWALTQTMNLGLWDTYSYGQSPLAFDTEGKRLNGGHRLQAFVLSKLATIVFPVVYDCEPEAFAKFDQNTKLRLKSMAHPGRRNITRDLARINSFVGLVTGQVRTMITGPLADYYIDTEYASDIVWAAETFPDHRGICRASAITPFMYARRADPDFATEMGPAWTSGIGLTPPLVKLRDELLQTEGRGGITRVGAAEWTRRVLNGLAMKHKGMTGKRRASSGLWGLIYFSDKLNDGVGALWKAQIVSSPEEKTA